MTDNRTSAGADVLVIFGITGEILDARRADAVAAVPIQLDVTFAEMGGE